MSTAPAVTPSQKILTTAFICLSERGCANVSMRDIAGAAGVALSQLTYYYKNKEGLFLEVLRMMTQDLLDDFEHRLHKTASPPDTIIALTEYFQDLLSDKPAHIRLFVDFAAQGLWHPAFAKQMDTLFERMAGMTAKHLLRFPVYAQNFKDHCPRSLARLMIGTLYGACVQTLLAGEQPDEEESPLALTGRLLLAKHIVKEKDQKHDEAYQ